MVESRVGFGLLGRLIGGSALGLALLVLFHVVDARLWFLAYPVLRDRHLDRFTRLVDRLLAE